MRIVYQKQLAAIAILNFLMSSLTMGDATSLEGRHVEAHSPEARRAAFTTFFFGIQLGCI